MDWLIGETELLGVAVQHWMLVVAGALLIYVIVLNLARRRSR